MNILQRALFLSLICVSYLLAGSSGKIAGIVTDADSGEPLPGVNIVVKNALLGAASDLDGYYVILNVPPGRYTLEISMVGYGTKRIVDVVVQIDQTTSINAQLRTETLDIAEEITVVAQRPVVEMDVAGSRANITADEMKALPVTNVSSVVSLQAGIEGSSIRGGGSDEVAWIVDGLGMRNERNNTSFNAISLTSVEEVQVQTSGFSAEFGNARSGMVNVVTKEGNRNKYDFGFLGRYRAAAPKHFGQSPNAPDAYWIRPYVDEDVCWVGTKNGTWDKYTQKQYPEFVGFNEKSRELMTNSNPDDDLSPAALQQLFLWEHRRQLDIKDPDYSYDMSFGGPVPLVSKKLGDLRFHTSYRQSRSMYIVPLSDDAYRDYTWQMKITSDIGPGKKLMFQGLLGQESGTNASRSGYPGIFQSSSGIAGQFYNFSYGQGALFGTDYWAPTKVNYSSFGVKFTHAINAKTFYETSVSRFASKYDTNPGNFRDFTPIQLIGNNFWVDEAPFGLENQSRSSIINSMRMGSAFSTSRDSSFVAAYTFKFDFTSQINRFNNVKTGGELGITDSRINYGRQSEFVWSNSQTKWNRTPVRAALYVQDKLEFEDMVAQLGLRMDYSDAGGEWYSNYNEFDAAFSSKYASGIDTLLSKSPTKAVVTFSPRLAISFPITVNSKLYFNYGHFRQLPQPENLYLFKTHPYSHQVEWVANPNNPLPKTVAYEIGYEHNIMDQFLIRMAGYYKDISEQPKTVSYSNSDGTVSYSTSEPNSYEDIRGFEITVNKNRGDWFRGFVNYTYMVSTYGFFGYDRYYENQVQQREYEKEFKKNYQRKPIPRPYARVNLDFFTPDNFGPEFFSFRPLDSWRLNILGSWKAGSYTTWTGPGGTPPGIKYNVQWRDYWNLNLRFTKSFRIKPVRFELFVDISNAFNTKRLSFAGFFDGQDYLDYMQSLHFSTSIDGYDKFSYINIPGNDKIGDYRAPGVKFVPIDVYYNANSASEPSEKYLYYFSSSLPGVHGKGYYRYVENVDANQSHWIVEDQKKVDKILKDKAYIDMPNFKYFSFLNPRNIFWGLKISFDL